MENTPTTNLNINLTKNTNNNSPLVAKLADTIGYAQDFGSSVSYTIQDFVEEKPDFAFKTIAENLKSTVLTGAYSSFSELVDKLLIGVFRGVTLALSGWQFIKKLKEKTNIQQLIEEKTRQINQEIQALSPEQKAQLQREIEKLTKELDEKKLDLGINGGKVLTDVLGLVGAVAAVFSLPALATAAPYLIATAIVGDIVSLAYYAYKSVKKGIANFNEKVQQRRNKEFTQQEPKTSVISN